MNNSRLLPASRHLALLPLLLALPAAAQSLSSVTLSPTSVTGGATSTGTVTLGANAPAGGKVVALSSANTGVANVPASVTVASGTKTKTFTVSTVPRSSNTTVVISGVLSGVTRTSTLTVKAPVMSAASVSPTSVKGGTGATLTVTLTGNAPAGGTGVTLTSSNTQAASLPAAVTVVAGAKTATAPVTTLGVDANATVTLTATAGGVAKTASLTVSKPALTTLAISPSTIPGGGTANGTLTLTGPAGPSGATVTLSSNKTNVATVPASKMIGAGQVTATFTVTGTSLPAGGTATITATWSGVSKTATMTLQPSASLQAVDLTASTVRGGQTVAGTVTLSASAPSGGVTVSLTSSDLAAATVPATVTVLQGQTTAGFTLTTAGVGSPKAVTITGISSGVSKTAALTVEPAVLTGLTISPETISGGTTTTGTLTLDGPAGPSGATVVLESSDTNVATVPPSTVIGAGASIGTFQIDGAAVAEDGLATISATLGTETHGADVFVNRAIGTLTGTVRDASTGFTLPSAWVFLASDPSRETWTDGNGQYQLTDIPEGTHVVEASYEGFSSVTSDAVVVANGETVVVPPVSLLPNPGTISGTILDEGNGNQPLEGALVTDATGLHAVMTDAAGHYELSGLEPGFTYLVIYKDGFRPGATEELSVDAAWTAEANVGVSPVWEEDRPGEIEGVVRDTAGIPVGGAAVSVVGVPGLGTTSEPDGSYTLTVPAANGFVLEAQKPGYRRTLSRFIRASAGSRPYHVAHDFVLPPADATGTIELRALDPVSRSPFRGDLWFRTPLGLWHAPVADSGIRTVTGVPAGLVWGCAGPALLPAGGSLAMSCPGEPVVPEGSPRWAAAGIVMNRYSYQPVADATATFVNGATVVPVTTDANGLFSTHSGPEGDYSVTVDAPGFLPTEPWVFTAADHPESGNFYGAWLWPEMPGGNVTVPAPEEGALLTASSIQVALSLVSARPGDQLLWAWAWPSGGNVTSVTPAYAADGMSAVVTIDGTFPNGPLTLAMEAVSRTGAGFTVVRNVTIGVPSRPTGLTLTPASVGGESVAMGTVTIDPPAPAGGASVSLASSSPAVAVPASLLFAEAETVMTFEAFSSQVEAETVVTISASAAGATRTATLTVNPRFAPPLVIDLAEGGDSGWQGFADPPYTATVSLDTTHVKAGASSLRFVTDSGFDCGVRYVVPGGAHWDLSAARFLTFWSLGQSSEAYDGAQPVVILRGPGGSIRLQPPAVQTVNGEWRFHRVPLGHTSDWTVTTEGAPSLADITSFEIHQDTAGFGLTVFYDGVAFISSIPEDLAEGTAALWGTFASDNLATSVVDDGSDVRSGASALLFDTASGFDTGLVFPKPGPGQTHWDLSDVRSVTAWIRAEHVESFQGNYPVLVLRSPSGLLRYEPGDALLNTPGWRFYEIPLDGSFPWTRTQDGTPDLADVTAIELHGDIVQWGFRLHVDGVSVGRPLPLLKLPSASTPAGTTITASVFLSDAVPAGGRAVVISSSDPGIASVPASVVVPEGARSATFSVTTSTVTTGTPVTITVADRGFSAWTSLRVDPVVDVTSLTLAPLSTIGGLSVSGTVAIAAPAWAGGTAVTLTSSNPAVAAAPAVVTVPVGGTTASFNLTTSAVAFDTPVTFTASAGAATAAVSLTVLPAPPPEVASLVVTPSTVLSGSAAQLTVSLATPAPVGGAIVALAASPAGLVSLPASVTVAAGATTAETTVNVPVSTGPVEITLTATVGGTVRTAALTVAPPAALVSVSASPTAVAAGGSTSVLIRLVSAAPPGGKTVSLTSSVPDALVVPATATVLEGSTTASVTATAPASAPDATVTITVSDGSIQKTATVAVQPTARLAALSFAASGGFPGESVTGTLTLTAAAPFGGYSVDLISSQPGVISVPAAVVVPAGQLSTTFLAEVAASGPGGWAMISASQHGVTKQATVTRIAFSALLVSPSVAVPRAQVLLRVSLTGGVPAGRFVDLTLASSNPAVASVPATAQIPANASHLFVPVTRTEVASDTQVEFTVTALGETRTATVLLEPLKVISVAPISGHTSVGACSQETIRITTNASAPAGGAAIQLQTVNGRPITGSPIPGSSPPTYSRVLAEGEATLDVITRANWTLEPLQLGITALLEPSQVTLTMPIQPGTVSVVATPSTAPRGSTVRLRLGLSGDYSCIGIWSFDAAASSDQPAVFNVAATVPFTWSNETWSWYVDLPVGATALPGVARLTFALLGTTATVDVTVPESVITDLIVNPTAAPAGAEIGGRAVLDSPAPPEGPPVHLESSDPSRVSVPSSVLIAGGASSVLFPISIVGPIADAVTVTATYLGVSRSASVRVLSPDAGRALGRVVEEWWWDYTPGMESVAIKDASGSVLTTSAEDGRFSAWLEPGTTLTLEKPGFVSRSLGPIDLPAQGSVDLGDRALDMVVTRGCRLFGRVVDAGGQPVQGAALKLVGYDLNLTTDAEGGFTFVAPLLYRYRFRASKEDFATIVHDVTWEGLGICSGPNGLELDDLTLPMVELPELTAFWAWPPVLEWGQTATLWGRVTESVPPYDYEGSWLMLSDSIARHGYEAGPVVAADLRGAGPEFSLDHIWWMPLINHNTAATAFTEQHAFFYGGVTKTTSITYLPRDQKAFFVSCRPPALKGATNTHCEVNLGSDVAPAGGLTVELASASPLISVPVSVVVPAGVGTAHFYPSAIAVPALTPVTITATEGTRVASTVIEIAPPMILGFSQLPPRVTGGGQLTGSVSLDSSAPAAGVSVTLSTSSAGVGVPPTVTIPAGATFAPFTIAVSPSAPAGPVTLRASLSGRTRTATIDIGPPRVGSLSLSPASLQAGASSTGTVALDLAAPAGGVQVSLLSSDPAVAQVLATVEVPSGMSQATFTVTTSPVSETESVTVTASISGSSKTATLEVRVAPPSINGAAPGVALPGTPGIVVYGSGLGVVTSVLLSGPVYPIGGATPLCNIRGPQGPFCPEVVAEATPSADGKSLTFSLPSNASTGTYLLEVKAGQLLSTNGVPFLVEEPAPAFEVVAPQDHKLAQRIYPGQTVQGVLAGTAPNCPYGATDYNQYFFFGTAGSRINVRMERVDTSVPWSDPSSLDPQIEVVAPDGFIYGNLARFNDRPGVDFDATISNAVLPQTGLYVILAETARGSGEYRLSFSFSSLAPAPPENRAIPVAGNHVTGHVGDVITSWAAILDPRGHPLSGANTTFQTVAEPGDTGTIQFTSGANIQSSSTGTAAVSATLSSFGRVRFEPVLQQIFTAPAAAEPDAPALRALANPGGSIPFYPAVAMRPFTVGHFDGQLLGVESTRFERFPLRAPAVPSGPFEEPASGARLLALGANAASAAAPQPYGPDEEARGEVPVARFGVPTLAATSCQDGLRFHSFAVLPSVQINAPLTVTLEDLTPSTGGSTPNGPVGDKGIYGHRVEKEIRLRISVRDANGNEPGYPVLVSVYVGGWASGQIILDPEGARIECPSATFVWHERDVNGAIVALNEVVGYRLGTYSDFVGLDLSLRPVWKWTELFEVKTFTPGQEEPSLQVFGVHPEPGKPDQILCKNPNGESCGEVHKHWTGYLAHENGKKPDGSPRYFSGIHATLTAYRLVDEFENDTFGYFDTSVAEAIPSTDIELVPHVPGEVRSDQLQTYKLRVSWTNDPAWPSGSYPATLAVHYPTDPDWPAGDVTKEIAFSFETGQSHAISGHPSYDLIRPDGTRGVDDGSFPIRAYSKATAGFLPKTEAGDGARLVLLAYRGEIVPGEIPVPEPTEAGLRMWQPEGDHWRIAQTRTSSFLETSGPSSFRFTLIDSSFNVIQDGAFVVHRCPRFDHSAPGAARPCSLTPVASINGQIDTLPLNPGGPGAIDSRGYLGLELTRAPEGLGLYYVMVESLSQEYRLRRQSDLMSTSDVVNGEFQGAFKLVNVGDYPCPDPRCGTGGCNQCTGSPNYVSTGTYTATATDMVVPTSGPAMTISRNFVSTPSFDGVVGPGWTSSLESRVYLSPYISGGVRLGTEANVVLPSGLRYKFRLNSVTGNYDPPAGRNDDLVRNADGSFDFFLERGSGSVYRFDKHGRFVSETDEFGNVVSWERDAEGRVTRMADVSGTGRSVTIAWTGGGKVHTLTDSAGRLVTYDYDADGRLTGITDPAGRRTQYSYSRGRYSTALLTKISDPWGRAITDITYDDYDRTKSYTEQGTTYTYTYAASNRTTKVDDSGHSTENTFDPESGVITSRSDPGDAFNKIFDSEGRPVQVTDAAGILTTYTYDGEGHILTVTRNATQTGAVRYDYTYDPAFPDKVASVTPKNPTTNVLDASWQGWRYEYHPAGSTRPGGLKKVYRVASDGTTADSVSEYEYDGQGRVRRQTTAGGAQTDYDYDGSGNLQTVTGPAGSGARPVTTYEHDALGRVTDVTDPLGKVTHYTYDALGRVLTVTLPPTGGRTFTTTYSYDHLDGPAGLLYTEITDPNGRLTRLGYDVDGRLRRSVDADGGATTYGYTGRLLTTITDPNGNVTTYGYDAAKRLASTAFPDGGQETYTYWNDGLLKTKTDRRETTVTYVYDAFKRLRTKSYSTGGSVTYNYEGQKLLTVVDTSVTPVETHTFGYDGRYRLASAAQAGRGAVGYTYTVDDRVETLTLPGGVATTNAYNSDGSLDSLQWSPVTGSLTWDYTSRGQYDTVTFPNGQERAYLYDDQGRLTNLSNTLGATTLASFSYGYDVDLTGQPTLLGQRTSQTSTLPAQGLAGALTRYGYDPLYQLTRAEYPAAAPFNAEVHTWTYDGIGNRESQGVGANVQTYSYLKAAGNPLNGQRLTGDGVDAFGYDAAGNVTGRQGPGGAFTFGYDPENRLNSVTGPENATYTYDYQGRRTSKTVGGVTTTYLYDGLNLVSETTGSQTTYFLNGPGIDEPLAMARNGAVSYFSVDGLGSVVATNDPSGTVTHSVLFDAWGSVKAETGTRMHPFTYTGREVGEAGFHFYRARFYQPGIGRFIQEDPMAPTDGPSLYRYVRNSPIPFTDPEGAQSAAKGHHYVPKEVFRNIPGLSQDARQVFLDSTTDILPKGSHYYDRAHRAYTAAVRDHWSAWMTQRGIVPSKMSSNDALAFLNELRRSRDPRITNYIRHLNLAAFRNALHFRSLRKLVRGGAAFLCPIDPVGMLLDLTIDDYDQALADAQPLMGLYAPYLVVPPKEIY